MEPRIRFVRTGRARVWAMHSRISRSRVRRGESAAERGPAVMSGVGGLWGHMGDSTGDALSGLCDHTIYRAFPPRHLARSRLRVRAAYPASRDERPVRCARYTNPPHNTSSFALRRTHAGTKIATFRATHRVSRAPVAAEDVHASRRARHANV